MKKVTIYDIAAELNISTTTVNRALNNKPQISNKTRALVLKKAEELGYSSNRAAKSLARHTIQIDFIIYNHVPVFHNEVIAGARQAFKDLRDFNVHGEIHEVTGTDFSAHEAILQKMDELYEKKTDGVLLLSAFDFTGIYEAIELLQKDGTKVAMVNGDFIGSGRNFAVRQNDKLAGRMAAELLYRFAGPGPVAAFSGKLDIVGHKESIRGFCEECKRRGVSVATVYENYDDPEIAAYNTMRLFREYPGIKGLYVNSANSEQVCRKLVELGHARKVKLVTSDLFDVIRSYMKQDVVQATIFQDPFRQGYMATEWMYKSIAESVVPEDVIFIEPTVILQSNV